MTAVLADVVVTVPSHRAVRTHPLRARVRSLLSMYGVAAAQLTVMTWYATRRIVRRIWSAATADWWMCQIQRLAAVSLAFLASQLVVLLPVLHGDARICISLWLVVTLIASWYFWLRALNEFVSGGWR
jgi:hypothetical protein